MNYCNEFGHCNPYFDQNDPNWGNSYTYDWDNQCAYNTSPCLYDYQFECVQYESNPSWKLVMEHLTNTTSDHFNRVEERLDELVSHFGRI